MLPWQPFDVVKTRQSVAKTVENVATAPQAMACNHGGHMAYQAENSTASSSVFAHMRTIHQAEGVAGLWRGNQTRMIKVAPSCAIMIFSYDLGKRVLLEES